MAMTPFPNDDASKEFIDVLVSNDGNTWSVPGTNPKAGAVGGWNADPSFVLEPDGVRMWCAYVTDAPGGNSMKILNSTDGVTWANETEIHSGIAHIKVSPTIIYNASLGKYQLWHVKRSPLDEKTMYYSESSTPGSGWSDPVECTINNIPSGKDIWHINVNLDAVTGEYHMLACFSNFGTSGNQTLLYFSWSADGITWETSNIPLIDFGPSGAWDQSRIYQGAWVRSGGNSYDLFYSARSGAGEWHIGRTAVTGI